MQSPPEAETETPSSAPKPASKRKFALPRLSGQHVLIGLLAINMVVTGALWFRVMTDTRPVIATIGLTSLARNYAQSLASDPTISPEALQIRTQLFMAEGQKEIDRLTADGGMVLLARECVLKGEDVDLTPQFAASLNTQLAATKSPSVGAVADVPAQ